METLVQDLRYAMRALGKNPGFALLAVLTLGLGIGANTAIFSVINGVLLKPLPYADADRLVLIRQSAPLAGLADTGVSIQEYFDYRDQSDAFEHLVEFHQMNFDLLSHGEPDRVDVGVVSHDFFDVLGIAPVLGRAFVEADDRPGAEAVLLLSYTYWQAKFGGDPAIVGQVFEMNDRPHRVVGVLPNVPHYPRENDIYMPVSACPFRAAAERNVNQNRRIFSILDVFGRLRPGMTPAQADASVSTIGARFARDTPAAYRPTASGFQATTMGVRDALTSQARPMLFILLGTTGMVLLIACANVANLTLARLLQRDRELAMRTALGAGRGRLVRQLLTESAVTGAAGGIVGLVFASFTVGLLTRFVGLFTERTGEIAIDPRVLGFTLLVAIVTGIVFGTLPAFASRVNVAAAVREGTLQAGDGVLRRRLQSALVVAQVAVSVVLLSGAGLLLASFYRLQQVDPGYDAEHVLSAEVYGNFSRYGNIDALRRLYEPILDRLAGQPGVVSAAITNAVPLTVTNPGNQRFDIEGRVTDDPDRRPSADVRIVSPGYFETLDIPLLTGRTIAAVDRADGPRVVVVNRSMFRYWEGTDPVGSRISLDRGTTWLTVVGVVGDVRQFGLARDAVAQIYVPLAQSPFNLAGRVLVRTAGDPLAFAGALRAAVRAVDPNQTVENIRTLEAVRDDYLATPRLTATLLTIFAALALLVTLAGITGVIAASVSQRTREFGVRMALGATRRSVLSMVLRQGLSTVGLGLLLGVAAAVGFGRVLQSYLYDTAPADPLVLAAVACAFVAAAALACLGPARRATTVDPLVALRTE